MYSQARKFVVLDQTDLIQHDETSFMDKLILVQCVTSKEQGYLLMSHGCRFNLELKDKADFLAGCNPWFDDERLVLGRHQAQVLTVELNNLTREILMEIKCEIRTTVRIYDQIESDSYYLTKEVKERILSLHIPKHLGVIEATQYLSEIIKKDPKSNEYDHQFVWYVLFQKHGSMLSYAYLNSYELKRKN